MGKHMVQNQLGKEDLIKILNLDVEEEVVYSWYVENSQYI